MEKLNKTQQTAIQKMSDLKLIAKLLEAGVEEQVVTQMDRNALMNACADMVTMGKDKGAVVTSAQTTTMIGYNPEVEKQRLAFEKEIKMKELELKEKKV